MSTSEAREQQRALYGAPLGELGSQVMVGLGLTQGRLAEALGLSAPMLSQLMTGQRVKIGNPAVVHRLQSLLQLVEQASHLSPEELAGRLRVVRDEQATLTGQHWSSDRDTTVRTLAAAGGVDDLVRAAVAVEVAGGDSASALARLLRDAAGAAGVAGG